MKTLSSNDRMPFGKYKGQFMNELPYSYIIWLYINVTIIQIDNSLVRKAYEKDEESERNRQKGYDVDWKDVDNLTASAAIEYY